MLIIQRPTVEPLDRAAHGVALGALQVELHLLPPAEAADRSCVTGHFG